MNLKEYINLMESKSEKALPAGLKVKIINRFNKDSIVTLEELRELGNASGKSYEEMVEAVCDILQDFLFRRKEVRDAKVNPKELKMGIAHEMEHTKDKDVAEIIARDHLVHVPNYYTLLKEIDDDW